MDPTATPPIDPLSPWPVLGEALADDPLVGLVAWSAFFALVPLALAIIGAIIDRLRELGRAGRAPIENRVPAYTGTRRT